MTNLLWLLLSLALATAPHLERLPLWVGPICLAMGLWRFGIMRTHGVLPRKWLLILTAFAATAGIFAHYHTLFGRDAGVALLVVMIALKLMEMKTLRDTMVVIFLSYFLLITHFFYSQSIPTALYLLLVVLITTATMIGYNHPLERFTFRPRLRLAGVMLLQAIPLMLVLFVFFPRVGPLWGLPKDAYSGLSGLSDSMSPGAISRLIRSDAVAFRVKFDGPLPDNSQRYWRGPVLWDYDGRTWSTRNKPPAGTAQFLPLGKPISYAITLEPHDQRWLFALDLPAGLPPGSTASADFQILAPSPLHQRIRYSLTSYPSYRLGENLADDAWERALSLPGGNPGAMQLAAQWRTSLESPRAIAQQALKMFREENFFYTLNPPLLGEQAVDDFIFGSRRGFCEHYAGSFVFLMRAAGIPARVVTGYQGGEPNPMGDYMIVRQSDAHAWTEIWLDGEGWVRIDPTAAVSPSRIETGIASALPAAELPPALMQLDTAWLMRMRLSLDLLNNNWNQWVLGYNQERQMRFLSSFHQGLGSWQNMTLAMLGGLASILLGISFWMLWRASRQAIDPVLAAYQKFCAKLARRGIVRASSEGAVDFAARASRTRPELARQIRQITRLYVTLRYGQRHAAWLPILRKAVQRFKP
ncbi:MAG: DUF3488 and transglutaminase-like domain-containing protein [Sulfuricella sp.]|jgi:transglutaminase-like putative cysteine protease